MLMLLFFFVPALFYSLADLVPPVKAGERKMPLAYVAVMGTALLFWVCVERGVPLKSPSEMVTAVVRALLPPIG